MEKTFENGEYYAPGEKVLYYFSVTKILPMVIIFTILGLVFDILQSLLNLNKIVNISTSFFVVFGIIFCIFAFIIAWIKYKSIQFMFDEFAFHIKKGFFSKSEISIPFRQIQYINHSQTFNQKMLGIMNVVIETAGEDSDHGGIKDEGLLPILDTEIALSVEKELLRRSNISAGQVNKVSS